MSPEVTILMPCLNEAETLATCIQKANTWLATAGVEGEVLIADNGSTDGSQDIARAHGARVAHIPVKGYGAALSGGIAVAAGKYVIMGDADDSYDFSALSPFLDHLRNGSDLVMGNRFRGGIAKGAMPPLHYYLGNPVLTTIGRILFRSPCRDFHCGLRGFRRDRIAGLDLKTTGMEFASEMVVKATLAEYRITEVPTTLAKDGRSRPPHLRSWRDGWRHLRFLLLYSPRWLFVVPGMGLLVIGIILMSWLFPAPRQLGSLVLDVHTMLAGAGAFIVGLQAVIFGVLTKVFAISEGLLPEDPTLRKLFRYVTLETGLVLGSAVFLMGIATCLVAVGQWRATGYEELNPREMMRYFIPGITFTIAGFQLVLASFYLSILGLARHK